MNIDFSKIGQFLLKLVKLPPRQFIYSILLLVILGLVTDRIYLIKSEKINVQILNSRIDSCNLQSKRESKWFALKLDSVRVEESKQYKDQLLESNKRTEEALKEQREANKIMEQTIINLSKHR